MGWFRRKRQALTEQAIGGWWPTAIPPKVERTECPNCVGSAEMVKAHDAMRAEWKDMYRRKCEQYAKVHGQLDVARREVVEKTAANAELAGENRDLKQQIARLREAVQP